jgi:hypothetical protein
VALEHISLPDRAELLLLPWPVPGRPGGWIQFDRADDWRAFIDRLALDPLVPDIVSAKYARAQKLYLAGWIDLDLIKAGELVGLAALELALRDRYAGTIRGRPTFAALLKHMVDADDLDDKKIPVIARCGGSAVGQLTGETRPTLAERRNALAHGDPFDGAPTGGLLELVRDLIEYAYRGYFAEGRRLDTQV